MATVDGFEEPTKAELLARVEESWREWQDLVRRIDDPLEPGLEGDWSLKDVIAHVCAYQRHVAGELGGDVRQLPPMPAEIGFDLHRRNAWLHELDWDRPLDDVVAEDRAVHAELVGQIEARSPDQLRAQMVPWAPWPVWRWVISATYNHYPDHVAAIRLYLGGRPAGSGASVQGKTAKQNRDR